MAFTASKLLEIAIAEIGYKEKASNSQLDSKDANAGSGNWTKYARDLHTAGYYQAPKNGYAWCDMFVDWCFLQLGGSKEKGEWLECQTGLYGAGCEWSSNCYRWADRCGTEPRVGAQVFFAKNGKGSEEHTGIVEKFDANYVYTIEGNASNMVKRKTYARNSDYILCYGYPRFDETSNETQSTVSQIAADHFSKDDVVKIVSGANWLSGSAVPGWVVKKEWIVKEVSTSDGRVVVDKSTDGHNSINSPIHYSSLSLVKSANSKADAVEDEFDGSSSSSSKVEYTGLKYSDSNPPIVCMQTQSTCYKGTTKMNVLGVLWHSTGANNKTIKRYVQPSDNDPNRDALIKLIGKNQYGNDWNHISHQAGLNCWIGTLADGSVATVQTMPWNFKPWGCGSGKNGSCNNGWIQFEICEDSLTDSVYFNAAYKEACEITAFLCRKFNLDPHGTVNYNGVKVPVILCHADSYDLGLGSNHGDIDHWFPKHGKSMATVRNDVAKLLANSGSPEVKEEGVYTKGQATQLSTNFKSTEFDCHGDGCCTKTEIDTKLVEYLQKIRDHFGKPLNISSGYRCAKHNKNVGGVTGSRHLKGQAADIYINGVAPVDIARYAESINILGIGLYETDADGHFVHIDTRETKSFWYGQAQQKRDTFQEAVKIDTSKVNTTKADPEYVWKFLKAKGLNDFAVAGLMGNLLAESNMLPINLQNTYEKKLGMSDAEYTAAVDQGIYKNFVRDSAGYGLVQWTYYSRKEDLLKYAQAQKKSIGDLDMQLEFLWKELQSFRAVMRQLSEATSVRVASDVILHDFEAPADQSEAVEIKRASFGQQYYDKYAICKHTETKVVNMKSPTCIDGGYTGDKVCVKCGETIEQGAVVAKLDHDYILTGKVDATIEHEGYTGDHVCSRCGDTVKGEAIPKLSPIVVTPEEDEVQITIKKSWIQKLIEWLMNLLK